MEDFARLLVLLLMAAFLWNVAKGNGRQWLEAKFLGRRPDARSARERMAAAAPERPASAQPPRRSGLLT